MRMIVTVVVAIALTLMLAFFYYVSQPFLIMTANVSEDVSELGGWNTTGSMQMYSLIRLGSNIGLALAVLFIWVWVFISAQSSDWRGEEQPYGGY